MSTASTTVTTKATDITNVRPKLGAVGAKFVKKRVAGLQSTLKKNKRMPVLNGKKIKQTAKKNTRHSLLITRV